MRQVGIKEYTPSTASGDEGDVTGASGSSYPRQQNNK